LGANKGLKLRRKGFEKLKRKEGGGRATSERGRTRAGMGRGGTATKDLLRRKLGNKKGLRRLQTDTRRRLRFPPHSRDGSDKVREKPPHRYDSCYRTTAAFWTS